MKIAARNALLVFIDGTICDTRQRHKFLDSPHFHNDDLILKDEVVPGSVSCLKELAQQYMIVYLGARPSSKLAVTEQWLSNNGFPKGEVYLSEAHTNRLKIVRQLTQKYQFAAGIGDRWDDNEIHLEIGCKSIILKEFEGCWGTVRKHLFVGSS